MTAHIRSPEGSSVAIRSTMVLHVALMKSAVARSTMKWVPRRFVALSNIRNEKCSTSLDILFPFNNMIVSVA